MLVFQQYCQYYHKAIIISITVYQLGAIHNETCLQTRRSNSFVLVGWCGGRDGCNLDRRRVRRESCVHPGRPRGSSEATPIQAWSKSWTILHKRRQGYRSSCQHHSLSYVSTDRATGGNPFLLRLRPYPWHVAEFHGRPNPAGAPQLPGGATVQLPRSTANFLGGDVKVVENSCSKFRIMVSFLWYWKWSLFFLSF